MFEQGDLKFVILRLLDEKPRHGYEIIKEIEERFGGMYSPSPGTVYPTLTMLEDLGYARARPEESGKKIYEITEEGRAHLAREPAADRRHLLADRGLRQSIFGEPMMEVNRGFKNVGAAIYASKTRREPPSRSGRSRRFSTGQRAKSKEFDLGFRTTDKQNYWKLGTRNWRLNTC